MKERIAAVFATKTRDEWERHFEERDACVVPVLTPQEALEHPHNVARQAFVPREPDLLQPAPVPRLDRTPGAVAGPPPVVGADTRAVLQQAGYSDTEIEQLSDAEVVAWP